MKAATQNNKGIPGAMASTLAALGVLACVSFPGATFAAEEPPVDVNTASGAVLASAMSGVGVTLGKAIVEYRRLHGPFRSVDELVRVRGIGVKLIERSRDRLRVGSGGKPQPKVTSN